jgi:hypothetical protein
MGSFRESGLKSSPPFEKGRAGGISEPKFQKAKVIPKMKGGKFAKIVDIRRIISY